MQQKNSWRSLRVTAYTDKKDRGWVIRRKLRIDKDLEILDTHRHEISGANFICARVKKTGAESFITAWVAPWQKTISDYKLHPDYPHASTVFDAGRHESPPETSALTRDWQCTKVYGWEDKTTRRYDTKPIQQKHMDKTIRDICADFNLEALPKIRRHHMARAYADYNGEENLIRIETQRLNFVLHELAHAIDEKINGNKWAAHGPSFVRTLLAVVDRYMRWHDVEELEQVAVADKIAITPAAALPHLKPPHAG